MQTMTDPLFITISRANDDASFITVINKDTTQRHTFIVPVVNVSTLVDLLSNGKTGSFTLQDEFMSVELVLDSNVPLFWLYTDSVYRKFVRRLGNPRVSHS